jgi:nucleoside-diphosphate-sugar epimerase
MADENAFDEAIKGMSAVAHVATINTFDANPHNVIPQTVAGAINALKAAARESSVKQFVFTSSFAASLLPVPGMEFNVDAKSWNDAAVEMAWTPPPYDASRGVITYMASKVEAEKAVWKFVAEEKPEFVVNTVAPFAVFGRILNHNQSGSTPDWMLMLYRGELDFIRNFRGCEYIPMRIA